MRFTVGVTLDVQAAPAADIETLDRIQKRVLWLAVSMIHHANKVRSAPSGVKVGGHQASSASMVSIMTALYMHHLRAGDRVSVKPHAAPVLHAVNHLLGALPAEKLETLRSYGGLQSYPSRTKDPDPVDFSTGSVGIGATASVWSGIAQRYVADHFPGVERGRHFALVGDAELDEGAVWEAIIDPMVSRLGEVRWVVDLNRQSLDRVVPGIAAERLRAMFEAAGWNTVTVKYGSRLRELFARAGGADLRRRIDEMTNEEYQHLLRTPPAELRDLIAGSGRPALSRLLADVADADIAVALRDLGGHDLADLLDAFARADAVTDRPTVVFAYTIKAWRLPTQGHPGNHSALLSTGQWRELAADLGADPDRPWAPLPEDSPEAVLCRQRAAELIRPAVAAGPAAAGPGGAGPVAVPAELGRRHAGAESTQQAFGRLFLDVDRVAPEVSARLVTVSPDVASSTNLGGWINKVGIWHLDDRIDWFAEDRETLLKWRESTAGRHIELGIAEVNLVGLLGELGLTWARDGVPLIPIGTLYDPFVTRALEPWSFGIYAGGQSILVGTPSGVTLAPEGGAHQSVVTPSVGLEQPQCVAWEPAFGQDLEWAMLDAMGRVGRPGGTSAYFRLSTRPVDQDLARLPEPGTAEWDRRRRAVLSGGYRLREAPGRPDVTLVGMGAVMPEVLVAADELASAGAAVDVVCLTSADLVYRALRRRQGFGAGDEHFLAELLPPDRAAPMVTVLDGHPHTLAFLGAVNAVPVSGLGVDDFGQVGDVDDLYRHFAIDARSIAGAAWDLLDAAS